MKKFFILSLVIILSSCVTIFNGTKAPVTFEDGKVECPINLTIDGKKYYNVILPAYVKIKRGFKVTEVVAEAPEYETSTLESRKNSMP